ncbi:MAG: hypothetical protein QXR48_03490 [Candidatus Woesearchaeota archaeon]
MNMVKAHTTVMVLALLILAGCSGESICQKKGTKLAMKTTDALLIAQNSACIAEGTVKEGNICNDFTGTIWFDFEPKEPKEGCNPACVVNIESRTAEINWRCTGLVVPKKK